MRRASDDRYDYGESTGGGSGSRGSRLFDIDVDYGEDSGDYDGRGGDARWHSDDRDRGHPVHISPVHTAPYKGDRDPSPAPSPVPPSSTKSAVCRRDARVPCCVLTTQHGGGVARGWFGPHSGCYWSRSVFVVAALQYLLDLEAQVEEKKARQEREKKAQIDADLRREREAVQYSYFGKPGGGAPIRDESGNVRPLSPKGGAVLTAHGL